MFFHVVRLDVPLSGVAEEMRLEVSLRFITDRVLPDGMMFALLSHWLGHWDGVVVKVLALANFELL